MKFTSAALVNQTIWNLRLGDLPRGTNRGYINRLFNGEPPYTEQEREENNISLNVNFLDAPQLAADARRSYYNAFQSPGKFFTVTIDHGPPYSRGKWGRVITRELQAIMKSSRLYAETLDAQFASCVLHGIGPAVWMDKNRWIPEEKGIEDVLIPSDTLRSFRNLDHFAVFYQYTPEQLYRLTHGPKVDPAWNMPLVEQALQWAHNQTQSQLSYSDLFSPEKVEERFKQDLGFYGTDAVPTIDFWKFFYHEDIDDESGWRMKMVLDTPAEFEVSGSNNRPMPRKNMIDADNSEWLYDPGSRVYASDIEQLVHFQFADLSPVAPFRYHSIRSLGWLLYSVCHLQNRLLCKYNEATFENLLQYFRGNEQDKTRVQQIDLHNFGFVPDGVSFVKPDERWQINERLVESAIDRNRQRMEYTASQYRQAKAQGGMDEKNKTATQVMAEVNSAMSMVGSMLTQAYRYQSYQYREIARRFCIEDSNDPDVKKFRLNVLKAGVPKEVLNVQMWDISPEKVIGGGNKTLQIAMADALMQMRPLLDPDSQKVVDRINISAKTDNDDLAERLVPEVKPTSSASHDAANSFATLMLGLPVPIQTGVNHVDVIETLIRMMAMVMKGFEDNGGMANAKDIMGLQNVSNYVGLHLKILAQNKAEMQRVKQYGDQMGQLMNLLKGYAQRLAEQMQKIAQQQQAQGQGMDPKDAAKIQGTLMMAKVKADNAAKSHAERTAQRQVQFEQKLKQDAQKHQADLQKKLLDAKVDTASQDLVTAAEIRRQGLEAETEQPISTE